MYHQVDHSHCWQSFTNKLSLTQLNIHEASWGSKEKFCLKWDLNQGYLALQTSMPALCHRGWLNFNLFTKIYSWTDWTKWSSVIQFAFGELVVHWEGACRSSASLGRKIVEWHKICQFLPRGIWTLSQPDTKWKEYANYNISKWFSEQTCSCHFLRMDSYPNMRTVPTNNSVLQPQRWLSSKHTRQAPVLSPTLWAGGHNGGRLAKNPTEGQLFRNSWVMLIMWPF